MVGWGEGILSLSLYTWEVVGCGGSGVKTLQVISDSHGKHERTKYIHLLDFTTPPSSTLVGDEAFDPT